MMNLRNDEAMLLAFGRRGFSVVAVHQDSQPGGMLANPSAPRGGICLPVAFFIGLSIRWLWAGLERHFESCRLIRRPRIPNR